ncbi:FAD-dependent oxidoreductase [Algoriphagus sp.]|uniref:FAD-dependent oxidoreductase n=1 Tax=Algoriphagus sp. TaxID=1872435 RepID=UPI002715B59F|nr:FAD-dependent oxidoreductase [Algoriphagus sp.]MDO8966298.1 FAD-dependent oxidoreductase [Algoriphagus sp.]MDP3198275.1 FAD-dependent oxidoreductase [Algoriphagus sp.]
MRVVCTYSSQTTFGSIRMQPVFMNLGKLVATAAVSSMFEGIAVLDLQYSRLSERLLGD